MIRLYVTLIFAGICGAGLKYLLVLRKRLEDRESKAALFRNTCNILRDPVCQL